MTVYIDADPFHVPPEVLTGADEAGLSDDERAARLAKLGRLTYDGPIYPVGARLLGITGLKGSGKDTAAAHLEARYGWSRCAFADKLKTIATDLWDLSREQVHGSIEAKETHDERWGTTPRQLLQVLGTEVARQGHPETWIRYLLRRLASDRISAEWGVEPVRGWATSDCRFPNEADAIRKHGGRILRVVRPGFDTGVANGHASEFSILAIKADYVVVNEGTLSDLYAAVDVIIAQWPLDAVSPQDYSSGTAAKTYTL